MSDEYNFKCIKCGNTSYVVAENDSEMVLICDKCAEGQVVERKQPLSQQNIPKCPTCNSTNITRISAASKVINAGIFGLLGNKRKKTFHCNSCKYEW